MMSSSPVTRSGATACLRRLIGAALAALPLACAMPVPAGAADQAVERRAEHPDGASIHITGIGVREDSIVLTAELANAGDRDIRLNRAHSFVLNDGARGSYRLNPPPDNGEMRVPAHARLPAELVFIGSLNAAARRLLLSTNEGVGTADNPFDDAPVLHLDLPVSPVSGAGTQANHPDGVSLKIRNIVAFPSAVVVSLIAINGNDREIALNENDSLVLTEERGATDGLQPPASNRTLAVPSGERLEASLVFPRHTAGDVARVTLSTNDGSGGTPDNPFETKPVFKVTVPVDRRGEPGVVPPTRISLAPIARTRLSAPTAIAPAVAAAVTLPAPPPRPADARDGEKPGVLPGPGAPRSAVLPASPTVAVAPPPVQPPSAPAIQPATMTVAQLKAALRAEDTEQGMRLVLPADMLFGTSPGTLSGNADTMLEATARLIAALHPREILVAGHTDGVGRDDDNLALSERRAQAVAGWLHAHTGKTPPRIVEKGYGRTRPVAPNHNADGSDSPEGRQQNRRIEIYLRR